MAALGTLGMQYDDVPASPVICIQDAYKSYGSHQALAGVNLSVYPGTIFALLGPSGCGKTTLVNAIVGRSDLDAGSIFTSLKDLKEIGFMPQDISLFTRLSVRENMRFYGYLHNLDADEIERRSKYLSDLLALPPFSRRPLNLSGGQQRRVSLAVALLHDPKVLILDEPTVGLDPILSKNFWDRLREMANQGKTVVLTTHYIEEARQADRIGLMRNGKMLTQDTPLALLKEYNTDYLEDVFLALCYQENNKTSRKISKEETSFSKVRTFEKPKRISLSRIKAQLLKNFYVLKNNLVLTIFGLMLPLVLNICAKIAFAHDPYYLPLAIVNEEFPGSVENCPRTFTNSCILSNPEMMASCIFLNELKNRTYVMTEYSNYEDALQDHIHKRNRGIVQFTSNFTESLSERFMVGLMGASESLYESSTIQVLLDGAGNLFCKP
nr:PREDICTED: ABC transporter G family member 20-like [Bemisia tabaci]